MEPSEIIKSRFEELQFLLPVYHAHAEKKVQDIANLLIKTFQDGNKILICGNGGSAADAQHFAAEFVNVFSKVITRRALPAIALSTDTSVLTSISNDDTFDNIYSRQVEALAKFGDVLIVLTTSGSSRNCINAVLTAKKMGVTSIALTRQSADISGQVDISIEVPSTNTQHIQECHMLTYHLVAEIVENGLFGAAQK